MGILGVLMWTAFFFFQANLDRKLVVWTFILITDYHAGRKNIFGEKIEVNETNWNIIPAIGIHI